MHREEALSLLEASHTFPSDHRFHVIVRTGDRDRFHLALVERYTVDLTDRVEHVPSRGGTYVSVRVTLPMGSADEVLGVYDFFRTLDYLVQVM